jgi:glucosamine-6-phosphate deaminase
MKIERFDDTAAWVDGVVGLWCQRLNATPGLRMCLPAGHTPQPIYAAMGDAVAAGRASFRDAEIFVLDEYGSLAEGDPGRCSNMLRRDLLDRIDLPTARFHGLDTAAADCERVCRDYDTLLGRGGLDLTLLGIGLNGHLGMNEPGSDPHSATRRVELHASTIASSARYLTHANLPTWGITVGLESLLASNEVWLLANGAGKADIVARMVSGAVGPAVPATLLRDHPTCVVWLDAAAATLI